MWEYDSSTGRFNQSLATQGRAMDFDIERVGRERSQIRRFRKYYMCVLL